MKDYINIYGNKLIIKPSNNFKKWVKNYMRYAYPTIDSKCTFHNKDVAECKCVNHYTFTKRKQNYFQRDFVTYALIRKDKIIKVTYEVDIYLKNGNIELELLEVSRALYELDFKYICTISKDVKKSSGGYYSNKIFQLDYLFSGNNNYRYATVGVVDVNNNWLINTYYERSIRKISKIKYINFNNLQQISDSFNHLKNAINNNKVNYIEYLSKANAERDYYFIAFDKDVDNKLLISAIQNKIPSRCYDIYNDLKDTWATKKFDRENQRELYKIYKLISQLKNKTYAINNIDKIYNYLCEVEKKKK